MKKESENSLENPCFSCSIGQACCSKLLSLKLTQSEYQLVFAGHEESLAVQRKGHFYIVSSKKLDSCPHWNNSRCSVYSNRPIECRLFPYTIGVIHDKGKRVYLSYHSRVNCPEKKALLMPKSQAEQMVRSFAHSAFGDDCSVEVEHENQFAKLKHALRKITAGCLAALKR
jgi:Fe-S-cluster containining protein